MTILRQMAQSMKDLETLNLIHSTKDITCEAFDNYYIIKLLDIEPENEDTIIQALKDEFSEDTIIQALKDEFSTDTLSSFDFDFDSCHTLSFKIYKPK